MTQTEEPGPEKTSRPSSLVSHLIPRTFAGLALWLLIFAAGVAFSGVVLFAFYQHRVSSLEQDVLKAEERLAQQFDVKSKEFDDLVTESKAEIERAAGTVGSKTNEVTALLKDVGPAVAQVEGLDELGEPTRGTGFVVTARDNDTWILTTLDLVAGSVANKQQVNVTLGSARRASSVYSWDEKNDLALIILRVGEQKALKWAKGEPVIGERIWGISTAPGSFRSSAAEGHILDSTSDSILMDADVPTHSAGGPLLNNQLQVVGVLSLGYAPQGFSASNGWAIPIRLACQRVLRCPSD